MKRFYTIAYCTLKTLKGLRICDLLPETIVTETGNQTDTLTEVTYQTSTAITGWIAKNLLDEIVYALPHDLVVTENRTISDQDLKQYVKRPNSSIVDFNLCGPICVAYCTKVTLNNLLKQWSEKPVSLFKSVIAFNKPATTTGIPELKDILKLFPNVKTASFKELFYVPEIKQIILTAPRLERVLQSGWKLIIGVKIDRKGKIRKSGIAHWIVLTGAHSNGVNMGVLQYYNPATDAEDEIAWTHLTESINVPFGIGVL